MKTSPGSKAIERLAPLYHPTQSFAGWLASHGTIVAILKRRRRRKSRVISVRWFEFFQPIAVLAAARY